MGDDGSTESNTQSRKSGVIDRGRSGVPARLFIEDDRLDTNTLVDSLGVIDVENNGDQLITLGFGGQRGRRSRDLVIGDLACSTIDSLEQNGKNGSLVVDAPATTKLGLIGSFKHALPDVVFLGGHLTIRSLGNDLSVMECKTGDRFVDIKRFVLGTCPVELFDVGRPQERANASILNLASENDGCSGTDLRCGNLTWSASHNSGLLFICYVWVRIWIILCYQYNPPSFLPVCVY